jgi:D-amino-acid dehydrogenase
VQTVGHRHDDGIHIFDGKQRIDIPTGFGTEPSSKRLGLSQLRVANRRYFTACFLNRDGVHLSNSTGAKYTYSMTHEFELLAKSTLASASGWRTIQNMHMHETDMARISIIGGGIIGLLCARELLHRGHDVQVLDAGDGSNSASCGNAGIIAPGHPPIANPALRSQALSLLLNRNSPLYIPPRPDPALLQWLLHFRRSCDRHRHAQLVQVLNRLSHLSMNGWKDLLDDNAINPHLRHDGWAEVCCEQSSLDLAAGEVDVLRRDGFEAEVIDGNELRRRDNAFSEHVVGALVHPRDILTDPAALLTALEHDVIRLGGTVKHGCLIHDLLVDGRGRCHGVQTDSGDIVESEIVVLAAGIWSDRFARRHQVRLPMQAAKGYHVMLEMDAAPRTAFVCRETMIGVNPMNNGLRLAGTLELSGINQRMSRRRLQLLRTGAARYIRGIDQAHVTSEWNGLRPCTADCLPIIGPMPGLTGAFVATGHGMMGYTLGPATAQSIGELIDGEQTSIDLSPFDPARF